MVIDGSVCHTAVLSFVIVNLNVESGLIAGKESQILSQSQESLDYLYMGTTKTSTLPVLLTFRTVTKYSGITKDSRRNEKITKKNPIVVLKNIF